MACVGWGKPWGVGQCRVEGVALNPLGLSGSVGLAINQQQSSHHQTRLLQSKNHGHPTVFGPAAVHVLNVFARRLPRQFRYGVMWLQRANVVREANVRVRVARYRTAYLNPEPGSIIRQNC